jgi:hypothetical protein
MVERMEPDFIKPLRKNRILIEEAHSGEIKKKSGSMFFSVEDFENLNRLANMIVADINQKYPNSPHKSEILDELQKNSINDEEKNALEKAVTDKINLLLLSEKLLDDLYNKKNLKQLELPELIKKSTIPDSFPLLRLNRFILEEAYSGEIKKRNQISSFDLNDIENVKSLALKLQNAILSSNIMEHFSNEAQQEIYKYTGLSPSEKIQKTLVDELNELLQKSYIFDKHRKIIKLQSLPYSKEDLIYFKRQELEKAYPDDITAIPKNEYPLRTIWFNAWKYDKENVLWRALLIRILEELKIHSNERDKTKHCPDLPINKFKIWFYKNSIRSFKLKYNPWLLFNPPLFHVNDLQSQILAVKLWDPQNELSNYLKKQSSKINELLKNYEPFETSHEDLNIKLENEINKIFLNDSNLYKEIPLDQINLSDDTKTMVQRYQKNPDKRNLRVRNRLILEDAYLEEILDEKIEDLQTSLYRDVYREESGNLEFKPGKAIKGTLQLGLSAMPLIKGATEELIKDIGKQDSLETLLDSVQQAKKIERIEKVQFMEQFQQRFEYIIDEYYSKKGNKIVIFIDDLDRCLPEKALEILEAI